MAQHAVVLDTDIGSDVDDALALAVLLGSPEVELVGITTTYGDTRLRARIAQRFLQLAGRAGIPVVPGATLPLSGREVWMSGKEGSLLPGLADEPAGEPDTAAEWLVRTVLARPGEIDILAIGPLTNLAQALQRAPEFASAVRHVYLMGGRYDAASATESPEHNLMSDAVAAAAVFASELPITAVGIEITRQVLLGEDDVIAVGGFGALGAQLERELRQWMHLWDEPHDVPHDAVTAVRILRPELFAEEGRAARIAADGDRAGSYTDDASDITAFVTTAVDAPAVRLEILHRIAAAGGSNADPDERAPRSTEESDA